MMRVEDIQQRLQDIHMEVYSLDSLKDSYDDVNIHTIDDRIEELQQEKFNLQQLLDSCFDQIIGL
jgi:hypothetical protein